MGGAYTGSMLRQQPKRLTLMQKIRIKLRLDPPPKPVERKNRGGDTFGP